MDIPLLTAIGGRQVAATRLLLESKADARACCLANGLSALQLAVTTSQPAIVGALLEAGASATSSCLVGLPPLPLACSQQRPNSEIVQLLLSYGAQPNLPDENGLRPLQHLPIVDESADVGQLTAVCEVTEVLVLAGARLELKDGDGVLLSERQSHPSLRHIASQSAAKRKADKTTPKLERSYGVLHPMKVSIPLCDILSDYVIHAGT